MRKLSSVYQAMVTPLYVETAPGTVVQAKFLSSATMGSTATITALRVDGEFVTADWQSFYC